MHRSNRGITGPVIVAAVLAAGALVTPTACSDSAGPNAAPTYVGASATMEGGSGHTYVTVGADGAPTEIGIRISETALTNLPAGAMTMYEFPLPTESDARITPYDHVVINWNPAGHPPTPYMVPHFDFHFYQVDDAATAAIAPSDPQFNAKLALDPAAPFVPTNYQHMPPGGVPNMGAHWVDVTAPELNGQPFTSTFIYGSYNGTFMFAEPMVAKSYLESHATVTAPLKLPAQYAAPGYYPTTYTVTYDSATKEHRVALGGFVHRS